MSAKKVVWLCAVLLAVFCRQAGLGRVLAIKMDKKWTLRCFGCKTSLAAYRQLHFHVTTSFRNHPVNGS